MKKVDCFLTALFDIPYSETDHEVHEDDGDARTEHQPGYRSDWTEIVGREWLAIHGSLWYLVVPNCIVNVAQKLLGWSKKKGVFKLTPVFMIL